MSTADLFAPPSTPDPNKPPFGLGSMRCGACGEFVPMEWRDGYERGVLPAHGECGEVEQFRMADVRAKVEALTTKRKRPRK